jgi:hypothetical protein
MDPYYFLDLDIEYKSDEETTNTNDNIVELNDCLEMYPNGDWKVGSDDYYIIYNNVRFDYIKYDNQTKNVLFIRNDNNNIIEDLFHLNLTKIN